MVEIINGRRYDTQTAKLIKDGLEVEGQFSAYESFCNHTDEELADAVFTQIYRKKNGEYFASVWGGMNTIYGDKANYTGRRWIVPLHDKPCFIKDLTYTVKEDNTDEEWQGLVTACFNDLY